MDSCLSVTDQDDDVMTDQQRVSLVTSEHGYTMLLPQMDDDHHSNSMLNSYSPNMSDDDEDGYHRNGEEIGDLHIHTESIDDHIQLGVDLSVSAEDSEHGKTGDSCTIVSSSVHHHSTSDPILASTGQVVLRNQTMTDTSTSSTVVDSRQIESTHSLQLDNSLIELDRTGQPLCVKIYFPGQVTYSMYDCKWNDCTKSYTELNNLVNHVNDDHVRLGYGKEMEYKCLWKDCPRKLKGFNARYKMLIHVRTHTNEKPHRCTTCGKSFSRLENLKIHMRSHTGERPYPCPVPGCSKAYSNSSDRFKHVRTHQEDKPYSCRMPGCRKRYTDPSSLRKHVKTNNHQYKGNPMDDNLSMKQGKIQTSVNSGSGGQNVLLAKPVEPMMRFPGINTGVTQVLLAPAGQHVNLITVQNFLQPTSHPLVLSTKQTATPQKGKEVALDLAPSVSKTPVKGLSKDQDAPLDLSTSPSSENGDHNRTDNAKSLKKLEYCF